MDLHRYHYAPHLGHRILSHALLPISWLYGLIATLKRLAPRILYGRGGRDFGLPIISVGNLIAGGSGKTPFIIALCRHFTAFDYGHIAVISRGYKRQSRGLVWVSRQGQILADVATSGDEPYLIATALQSRNVSVLVCESRARAITQAKAQGAKLVLLDDGLRFCFKKLDVILRQEVEPFYPYFLPSGLYRESHALYRTLSPCTIIARENIDFTREVQLANPSARMFLISAIANPTRLLAFLPSITPESKCVKSLDSTHLDSGQSLARAPESAGALDSRVARASSSPYKIIGSKFFPDHHHFAHREICAILDACAPTSLLTTAKDATKLQDFADILSIMELTLHIHPSILCALRSYIDEVDSGASRADRPSCIADYLYAPPHAPARQCSPTPPSQSPVQMLQAIEQRLFASLARFAPAPDALESSAHEDSILLAWVWLPCDPGSVQNGMLDEALAILENAFCDGLVDFWLDGRLYPQLRTTTRLSLSQSFYETLLPSPSQAPHQPRSQLRHQIRPQSLARHSSAWHYLFGAVFAPLLAYLKGDSSSHPTIHRSRGSTQETIDLSWDSPELFSPSTLRIGLTQKGWRYIHTL